MRSRFLKFAKYLLFTLFFIAIGGVGLVYFTLSRDGYAHARRVIEQTVSKQTGRVFELRGTIQPRLSFTPSLSVSDAYLSNTSWTKGSHLLDAKSLHVSLSLIDLLQGDIVIRELHLVGADIHLERSKKGTRNWMLRPKPLTTATGTDDTPPPPDVADDTPSRAFHIDHLSLVDSTLTYQDHGSPEVYVMQLSNLTLTNVQSDAIEEIVLKAIYRDMALVASGSVRDAILLFDIQAEQKGVLASANGSFSLNDHTFDSSIELKGQSVAAIAKMAQLGSTDSTPLNVSASVGGTRNMLSISKMVAQYGDIKIKGNGKFNLSKGIPTISAALQIDQLDLKRSPDETQNTADAENSDMLLSDFDIPSDDLAQLNLDLDLKIWSLQTDAISFSDLAGTVSLHDGLLNAESFTARSSDGTLKGSLSLNSALEPPTASLKLTIDQLQLSNLLDVINPDNRIKGGKLKSTLNLEASGTSFKKMLGTSSGDLYFYLGKAQYVKPPLLEDVSEFIDLLRGDSDSTSINMQCAVGQFDIKSGVAKPSLLALKTNGAIVSGDGNIKLATEIIRMRLSARSHLVGIVDVVPPLVLTGQLGNPDVSLDAASSLLSIGKIVLGAATGVGLVAVIGEKVTDRLGITAQGNPCIEAIADEVSETPERIIPPSGGNGAQELLDNAAQKAGELGNRLEQNLKP